jgi:putative ATP-binding cassette transporter
VFAPSTIVAVIYRFTEERLGLLWRTWLTRRLLITYLEHPTCYRLNDTLVANGEIANPDQRIADDVRAFTATTLSFVLLLLNGTFTAVAFSGVMWSISPLLFVVGVLYAGAGSLATIKFGRPLVGLNYAQLDKEEVRDTHDPRGRSATSWRSFDGPFNAANHGCPRLLSPVTLLC